MKIAAGCFGCLAFIFLGLSLAWGVILSAVMPMLPSDVAVQISPFMGYVNYINSGCCCLSGTLAIVLLVVGSMKSKDPIE